jgi:hypothetical protein
VTPPAVLENLPWRIAGLLLIAVLVVLYQPDSGGVVQRLLIPVAMAVGAWLLVQNAVAVALGAGLLAALHSAPGQPDWIAARAYPALAAVCAMILVALLGRRFRRHVAATHDARWRHRRGNGSENDAP